MEEKLFLKSKKIYRTLSNWFILAYGDQFISNGDQFILREIWRKDAGSGRSTWPGSRLRGRQHISGVMPVVAVFTTTATATA